MTDSLPVSAWIALMFATGWLLIVIHIVIWRRRGPRLTDDELRRLNKWVRDAHTDVH